MKTFRGSRTLSLRRATTNNDHYVLFVVLLNCSLFTAHELHFRQLQLVRCGRSLRKTHVHDTGVVSLWW